MLALLLASIAAYSWEMVAFRRLRCACAYRRPFSLELCWVAALALGCSNSPATSDTSVTAGGSAGAGPMPATGGVSGTSQADAGSAPGGNGAAGGTVGGAPAAGAGGSGSGTAGNAAEPAGPDVDRSEPQLFTFSFTAKEADDTASIRLDTQNAVLDTRVAPLGKLVVFLHGAGDPTSCGGGEFSTLVASWGFHWFAPCYSSNYGIDNCGDDIGGCRLEAIEGVDHHSFIDIKPPDSVEGRVVQGLHYLAAQNPQGDWLYYLEDDKPKWSEIVVAGVSHGASSSGLLGKYRNVQRVVMLSGPLDTDQAWLELPPLTPADRYFGFTHTDDEQHPGHLAAFETLKLPGAPTVVDDATAPYGGSHRLVTSFATASGHNSTADGAITGFVPVWQTMFR